MSIFLCLLLIISSKQGQTCKQSYFYNGLQGVTLRNNFSLGLNVTFVKHQARSLAKLCQHEQLDKYSLVLIGLYSFVGAQIKRIYKLMACLQTLCLFKLKWCS